MICAPPICIDCARAHRGKPGPLTCDAFPEWLPLDILLSRHDHHYPYPGDGGLAFLDQNGAMDAGAAKAAYFEEEEHPRYPAGTPVDPSSGAGGGRFAPKQGGVDPGAGGSIVAAMTGSTSSAQPASPGLSAVPGGTSGGPGSVDYTGYYGGAAAVTREQLRASLAFYGIEDPNDLLLRKLEAMTPEERREFFEQNGTGTPTWANLPKSDGKKKEGDWGSGGREREDKKGHEEKNNRNQRRAGSAPPRPPCASAMGTPFLLGSTGGVNLYVDAVDALTGNVSGTGYTHNPTTGELSGCTPLSQLLSTPQWSYLSTYGDSGEGRMEAAGKAWNESDHPRHPAGTPVDDATGAGGGRFAPKDSAGAVYPYVNQDITKLRERQPREFAGKRVMKWFDANTDVDFGIHNLDEVERRMSGLEYEAMVIYGRNGEIVDVNSGDKESVVIGPSTDKDFQKRAEGGVLTHNHPQGGFLSGDDIMVAYTLDLSEIRAVTKAGTFVMKNLGGYYGEIPYQGKKFPNVNYEDVTRELWFAWSVAVHEANMEFGNEPSPERSAVYNKTLQTALADALNYSKLRFEFYFEPFPNGPGDAGKAWDPADHPRYPEGTPVDETTGAGGGRFAPKDGASGELSPSLFGEEEKPAARESFLSERTDDTFQRAIDNDGAGMTILLNESMRTYDAAGDTVHRILGERDSVSFGDAAFEMHGLSTFHNHPDPSSMSGADLAASLYYEAPHAAVLAGDMVIRLDMPKSAHERATKLIGDSKSEEAVMNWVEKFEEHESNALRGKLWPFVETGEMSSEEATAYYNIASLERMRFILGAMGGKLTVVERIPGFFTDAPQEDAKILEEAHAAVRHYDKLTILAEDSKIPRVSDVAWLYQDGASKAYPSPSSMAEAATWMGDVSGAIAVFNTTIPTGGDGHMPSQGAVGFTRLRPMIEKGVKRFYFAGLQYACKLDIVGEPAKAATDDIKVEFSDILNKIYDIREMNADKAAIARRFLKVADNDSPAAAATASHLAWQEMANRHPDLFQYHAVFYPKTDPYRAALNDSPVEELIGKGGKI